MYDLLSNLNGWGLILITAVAGTTAVLLVSSTTSVISNHLLKAREADNAMQLKQEMLDRGMSAEDIKTVLEAGVKK